jgi:hypothetical protein
VIGFSAIFLPKIRKFRLHIENFAVEKGENRKNFEKSKTETIFLTFFKKITTEIATMHKNK